MSRVAYVKYAATLIKVAHEAASDNASASTNYYDFYGNCFDAPGAGRIAVSNRVPINFESLCGAVEYELVLQEASRQ